MVNRKTWKEFKDSKMLWVANRTLHLFGWSIVFEIDDDGELLDFFPVRVGFRGFSEKDNCEGFIELSRYMKENATDLLKEAKR